MTTILIDTHLHTCGSHDCLSRPARVLEAARAAGLDRICVTDHNEIAVAVEMQAMAPDFVIVGEEVKTAEGVDLIGLFVKERIPKGTSIAESAQEIKRQGGVVVVPHPFAPGKGGGGALLALFEPWVDVVEIHNARLHDPALNARAVAWAAERHLPGSAGSDAHTLAELGRGRMRMPPFEFNRTSYLAALGSAVIEGHSSSRLVHLASTWAKVQKRFAGAAS